MKKKEEKTKNYVIVTIACITCFLFVATITSALNVFNSDNLKAITSSATKVNYSLSLVGQYDTSKSSPNTIQGSVGYNGKIYFSMSYNGGKAKEKGNYLSKTYYFNTKSDILTDKNISYKNYAYTDSFYNQKIYKKYKTNDLEMVNGKIFYLAMDGNHDTKARNNSILLFKYNNALYEYGLDHKFINIGYNASNNSFYSLLYQTGEIYNYKVKMSKENSKKNIETKKICNIKSIYYNEKGEETNNKDKKSSNYSVAYQGITMKGYLMYVPFQKKKYIDKDNGKYSIINYLAVYDTRNCKKNSTIDYSGIIKLGSEKETKLDDKVYDELSSYAKNTFELEDVFFMNSKLYLAYNAMRSKGISFYTLNFNNDVIKIKSANAKRVGDNVQLTAKIKSEYGIYAYKICDNESGTDCKYKGIKDENSVKYLTPYEKNLEEIVEKTNSNKWYLFIRDLYGNTKRLKIDLS